MGWWGGGERAATGEAACVCACARVSVCVCVCVCVPGFGVVLAKTCVAWFWARFGDDLRCLVSGLFWLRFALPDLSIVLPKIFVAWFRDCVG